MMLKRHSARIAYRLVIAVTGLYQRLKYDGTVEKPDFAVAGLVLGKTPSRTGRLAEHSDSGWLGFLQRAQ